MSTTLQKRYKENKPRLYKIQNIVFVPIYAQRHKTNLCFSQDICNYTANGREKIHKNLKAIYKSVLRKVMKNFIPNRTIEYNDNRISSFIAQYGRCAISGVELGRSDWHCHHKTPYQISKDDTYSNLIVLHESVHRLVHLKDVDKINALLTVLKLNSKQKRKAKSNAKFMSKYFNLIGNILLHYSY